MSIGKTCYEHSQNIVCGMLCWKILIYTAWIKTSISSNTASFHSFIPNSKVMCVRGEERWLADVTQAACDLVQLQPSDTGGGGRNINTNSTRQEKKKLQPKQTKKIFPPEENFHRNHSRTEAETQWAWSTRSRFGTAHVRRRRRRLQWWSIDLWCSNSRRGDVSYGLKPFFKKQKFRLTGKRKHKTCLCDVIERFSLTRVRQVETSEHAE